MLSSRTSTEHNKNKLFPVSVRLDIDFGMVIKPNTFCLKLTVSISVFSRTVNINHE